MMVSNITLCHDAYINVFRNLDKLSEFSTIDTAINGLGALFVGNYFGGEVINKKRFQMVLFILKQQNIYLTK